MSWDTNFAFWEWILALIVINTKGLNLYFYIQIVVSWESAWSLCFKTSEHRLSGGIKLPKKSVHLQVLRLLFLSSLVLFTIKFWGNVLEPWYFLLNLSANTISSHFLNTPVAPFSFPIYFLSLYFYNEEVTFFPKSEK